jgi:D-amino-acid oxidase
LSEAIVCNCTGLGARELFGDRELTPVKGQLTVLIPQPDVDYAMVTDDLYMFPRRDGIVLGGTFERGVETLEPNAEAAERILSGHRRIFDGMR